MTNTENTQVHAHVSSVAVDCDGPIYRDYVSEMNDAEVAESEQDVNDFSEIHFKNRVFTNCAGPYAVVQMTVEVTEDGFTWSEATEEGGRSGEVRWCSDVECDTAFNRVRDIHAEMMGY